MHEESTAEMGHHIVLSMLLYLKTNVVNLAVTWKLFIQHCEQAKPLLPHLESHFSLL